MRPVKGEIEIETERQRDVRVLLSLPPFSLSLCLRVCVFGSAWMCM
eukprot:COSAG06_NODE_44628_length_362_cov_0.315589_1_plen_45_part_01